MAIETKIRIFKLIVTTSTGEKTYSKLQYNYDGDSNKYSDQLISLMGKGEAIRFVDAITGKNIILNLGRVEVIEVIEQVINLDSIDEQLYYILQEAKFYINADKQFQQQK